MWTFIDPTRPFDAPSTPHLNVAGSPELLGGVVHDHVSVALFQTRLGSAKVSDGDAPLGITCDHGPHVPHAVLGRISSRITNEVSGINRVVYDISSKPPATIEWE